ncbi:formate dehydrogenase accessory sulfurtransferase FdhD [Paraferrimonas sedimenticola]|uniref:Sulfur carrier protein FdhD n=1 Tax=Paraferrimonas sedimenticola TaxID=375674 RepID=A0AA37RXZ7_9GAMM|nr:formate dehydrogenase accessory sulfurtransferase FdhD [Paraferrimonas sedimenticola]GLP97305.1 sulfurtransferase FdhD [Paraferrimonas sedimenticola]
MLVERVCEQQQDVQVHSRGSDGEPANQANATDRAKLALSSNVYRYRDCKMESSQDLLVVETPVALVYNGVSHVVLMCTNDDLEELAIGFSLTEGIIEHHRDIHDIEVVPSCHGVELHIEIANRCLQKLKSLKRNMLGRTGCGICGTESLERFSKPFKALPTTQSLDMDKIDAAVATLKHNQALNQMTGATHAAAYLSSSGEIQCVFEDVGRHVALDKLIGHICAKEFRGGAILVTSRASYEMVQKTLMAGIEILLAVSAPTEMAVSLARQNNLTLVGFCRSGRANVYSQISRLTRA